MPDFPTQCSTNYSRGGFCIHIYSATARLLPRQSLTRGPRGSILSNLLIQKTDAAGMYSRLRKTGMNDEAWKLVCLRKCLNKGDCLTAISQYGAG